MKKPKAPAWDFIQRKIFWLFHMAGHGMEISALNNRMVRPGTAGRKEVPCLRIF
jgi:hypothetical protein